MKDPRIEPRLWDDVISQDRDKVVSALTKLQVSYAAKIQNEEDRLNTGVAIITGLQHLGRHNDALAFLQSFSGSVDHTADIYLHLVHLSDISCVALMDYETSCQSYAQLISFLDKRVNRDDKNRELLGIYLLEYGKCLSLVGRRTDAERIWKRSLRILSRFPEKHKEHLQRVESNIVYLRLESADPDEQQRSVDRLEELIQQKMSIGDIQGASTNYSNLGSYFRKSKRYARAIAYYRKDLFLSRLTGNDREVATTLGNLATLYAELLQFSDARKMLEEASSIGKRLDDAALNQVSALQLEFVNKRAKESGLSKAPIGSSAECQCGSGKKYKDCCGLADFEPVSLPMIFEGISQDLVDLHETMTESGLELSPLDFILRDTEQASRRHGWNKINVNDGWMGVSELPDMANIHLMSAKSLLEAGKVSHDLSNNIAVVIISVCFLEAFINQLSFFLHEHMESPAIEKSRLPKVLLEDGPLVYQRTSSLETKWAEITDCIIGSGWLRGVKIWNEVQDLVYIRNEMVHHKSSIYEQIVPPPSKFPDIYKKIPKHIAINSTPRSWPFRIITVELAEWAVACSENLVKTVRLEYMKRRRDA